MKKTLIIQYTPRKERSKTQQLLDHFKNHIKNSIVEVLDLTADVPDLFMPENLAAYYDRNYGGKTLTPAQSTRIAKMDRMTAQLKDADVVVLAYPMYNFSLPATVKAWFDSVSLKGDTWDIVGGQYVGLLKGKTAVIITTSGGDYVGGMASWDHGAPLAKQLLSFLGIDSHIISPGLVNGPADKVDPIMNDAKAKLTGLAKTLY